jgi:predicted lipoprotein with Yx(FWY)xxD motif
MSPPSCPAALIKRSGGTTVRTNVIAAAPAQHRLRLLATAGALALGASLLVGAGAQAQEESAPISTASSDVGTFLVDGAGMTLYYFEPDAPGVSLCTDDCLAAWPAVEIGEGAEPVGDDSVTGTLSAFTREDGIAQATYRGRPLYTFVGDQAAGDTNGQGVSDVWWVASVDGALTNAAPLEDAALTLEAATTDVGTFITGADGRTAYFFAADTAPGVSNCAGDCLAAWPPVTVDEDGTVAAAEGVAGVIGVIAASDGSPQVTYDGRPLYYFAGDQAAGDTNGQAVSDVWWVATVDGLLPQG